MQSQEEVTEECYSTVYLEYDEDDACYTDAASSMCLASSYHPLYLQSIPMEFMFPIRFEEGMGYEECENYYASMAGAGRGKLHRASSARYPRRSSKVEIQQQAKGALRSCLRKPKRASQAACVPTGKVPIIRRNSACSDSSKPVTSVSELRELKPWASLRDMSEGPSVAFEPLIHVITIFPYYEYPDDVWSSIWHTPTELHRMVREATREHRNELLAARRGIDAPDADVDLTYDKNQEPMFEIEIISSVEKENCRTEAKETHALQGLAPKLTRHPSYSCLSDADTACSDFSEQ